MKRLRREELLEMLIHERKENDQLQLELQKVVEEKDREIDMLKRELADRRLRVEEAGTMAEAALEIFQVFERADRAAALYLQNVKARAEETQSAERNQSTLNEKQDS